MKINFNPFLLLLPLIFACSTPSPKQEKTVATPSPFEINFNLLKDVLMERMDLQPGEKVLLVAEPGRFDPIIDLLKEAIMAQSGEYLGTMSISTEQPEAWSTDYLRSIKDMDVEQMQAHLKSVDLGIMLPGATPGDITYHIIQENLKENIGRTIHFHWAGAYDLNGTLKEMSSDIDKAYQEILAATDYDKLSAKQLAFEMGMRGKKIKVTTPKGTDISFEIGDRPVTKQDGDASAVRADQGKNLIDREIELPAGAIRVAPIEATVNGKVAFPDSEWDSTLVKGLVLTFVEGKMTDMTADTGLDAVKQVMEAAGDAGKSFREFALGFNPLLAVPDQEPWIPYYGYGAGVIRLSLGDNSELGGSVTGGFVRWNFFTDATVSVGDDLWVQDGKMIK